MLPSSFSADGSTEHPQKLTYTDGVIAYHRFAYRQ